MSDSTGHRSFRPFDVLLRLFSSVRLGVVLLTLLFIYSSIGSAGFVYPTKEGIFNEQIRQWRGFEMTEFEWFHWWPFDLLIGLICVNIIVVTLRRIPFKPINFGVWMIHTGIVTLCVGSVIYFGTKVEGDAPVVRRQVIINAPGGKTVTMPAIPGNRVVAGDRARPYSIEVFSIDPQWELLSGEDEGKRAYSVTLSVRSPDRTYLRQVIAGYPDYTEDLIQSTDPGGPPFARAMKTVGTRTIDDALSVTLEADPQPYLYLANNLRKSWALYIRNRGDTEWVERPIKGLPLYNDYISSREDVWLPPDAPPLDPDPINVTVASADPNDPLHGIDLTINSYLRHAFLESRRLPGGETLDPMVTVRLANAQGFERSYELIAFDPAKHTVEGGQLQFVWVNSAEERASFTRSRDRALVIAIPDHNIEITTPIGAMTSTHPDLPFEPIEGSDYAFRVQAVHDGLEIRGSMVSIAMVEIRRGEETFLRWVFEDPSQSRDHSMVVGASGHPEARAVDDAIVTSYDPGQRVAPVLVIGGPGRDETGVQITLPGQPPVFQPLAIGQAVPVDQGITMTLDRFSASSTTARRPAIVAREQRDRDAKELFSMVRVEVPVGGVTQAVWVPFHHYPTASRNDALRRYAYRPVAVDLPDGRAIEMIFSRQRRPLPESVLLEDFEVTSHVGGFTGRTSSIRNWTSVVRFADGRGGWKEPTAVSVNKPVEDRGYWYFQAQWDPPMGPRFEGDRPSAGLNYTVLGVGNRNGVAIQLLGCVLAVIGMIYAFYFKPIIKRRRQACVHAELAAAHAGTARVSPEPEALVPTGAEEPS